MQPQNRNRAAGILIAGAALLGFLNGWEGGIDPDGKAVAYADKLANNLPTVCNGHTGPDVKVGDVWTKEQCDAILVKDVHKHGQGLLACITVPINQHQYDALTSWAFNVGVNAACGSTLVKLLNQGRYAEACEQLLRWNRAGGREVRGLTNRRTAERDLCVKPMQEPGRAGA